MELDLSPYHSLVKITSKQGKKYIYDPVRKKDFVLQPEELVRQTWIQYLHKDFNVNFAALGVEKKVTIGMVSKRYDMVYYSKGQPHILFEFKSYKIAITPDTAQQVASYNLQLKVPYLVLSNGLSSYTFLVDHETAKITQLQKLPF